MRRSLAIMLPPSSSFLFWLFPLAIAVPSALAQRPNSGEDRPADVEGSKDHPLIKRYEGSTIIGYEFQKFGDAEFLLGPVKARGPDQATILTPTRSERVEGQVTRLLYVAPEGRSPLEVSRNYEQELKNSGFETVYRCTGRECGGGRDGWLAKYYLYPRDGRLKQTGREGQVSEYALNNAKDQHFFTARRPSPDGPTYASVYVATNGSKSFAETFGHPIVLLDVIETAAMERRMVAVDADAMARNVSATGHVALYGIYFDTDRAELKPESGPTLEEIAKYLKDDARLSLYVVGHTDNAGEYDYNLALSNRRAAAVVKELTTSGIPAARLKAAGAGPLAPVASNDSEEGRAKNRRVELVRQ